MIAPLAETDLKLLRELRQVLAELELVSHVSAFNYESSGGRDAGESIGGRRPPGGVDRAEDRVRVEPGDEKPRVLRSVEHFKQRLAGACTNRAVEGILVDARDALAAWRTPAPFRKGMEPKLGDPGWKRYVAESSETASDLARRFGCKRSYIEKVRRLYRDEEAA